MGDVTELKSASRVHKGEWTDSGVPFFRSSDVMAAINGTTNEKAYISEELYEKLSNASGKLEEGDVLVTGGGSVGNPYIVPTNEPLYTKDADVIEKIYDIVKENPEKTREEIWDSLMNATMIEM